MQIFQYCIQLILIFIVCVPNRGTAQKTPVSSLLVDSIFYVIRHEGHLSAERKSLLADSAFVLSKEDICRQVYARILQSTHLSSIGLPDSALVQLLWANSNFTHSCDSSFLMALY